MTNEKRERVAICIPTKPLIQNLHWLLGAEERLIALQAMAADQGRELDDDEMSDWILASTQFRSEGCGTCTACCTHPAIEDLTLRGQIVAQEADIPFKAAGTTCDHCTGNGCGVYERRPSVCKNYACMWLTKQVSFHPMETGVCWTPQAPMQPDLVPPGQWLLMGHTSDVWAAIKDQRNLKLMASALHYDCLMGNRAFAATLRDGKDVVSFTKRRGLNLMTAQAAKIDQSDPSKLRIDIETQRDVPMDVYYSIL